MHALSRPDLYLVVIGLLLPQNATADPAPAASTTAASVDGDGAPTAEAATGGADPESPLAPPPSAPRSKLGARVVWVERPAADDEAKGPPILASSAQDEKNQAARPTKAWTLHLALAHDSLSGDDFDDSTVMIRQVPGYAPDATAIPTLGSGPGFGFGLGYGQFPERIGSTGFWAGISYSATWLGVSSRHTPAPLEKAVLHDLDFPLRLVYRASRHFAPHFQISYGFGFLEMKGVHGDVDANMVTFDNRSTVFVSRLLGIGVGALFPFNESFSLDAFAGYRVMVVSSVDGSELDDSLIAGGWMLRLGPALFF